MESEVLRDPKLSVPFWLFSFPSTILLYSMHSPQEAQAYSIVSIFLLAPLQTAASLCALLLCCPTLTPLSPLPKEALQYYRTDPGCCGTVRSQIRNARAASQLQTEGVGVRVCELF